MSMDTLCMIGLGASIILSFGAMGILALLGAKR